MSGIARTKPASSQRALSGVRARRRGEGQSLVEFAVTLPIFLLLLAGIVDFGMGLYSQMTIINAAREGARLGVVEFSVAEPADFDTVEGLVVDRVTAMSNGLDASQLEILVECQPAGCVSGDAVVVNVNYDYRMIWPLAFGNSIGLSSTVQMRIE
ncbi:MAG: TadE/TadG family type IV pilus assembly protein [Aeromicrobium sp.]